MIKLFIPNFFCSLKAHYGIQGHRCVLVKSYIKALAFILFKMGLLLTRTNPLSSGLSSFGPTVVVTK